MPSYGTFVQLNTINRSWSPEQWEEVFVQFQRMGFHDIVIQWSASGRNSFEPLLQRVLDTAAQHKMQVWIGLWSDATWWRSIAMPTRCVELYLWKFMNIQMALADRIIRKYGLHRAFSGIYLPMDIDDSTWFVQDKFLALTGALDQFSFRIREEYPGINIALSGFSEGLATPEQVATLWYSLIMAGRPARVYFRDSVGVRVLEPEESVQYLKALHDRLPAGKTTLIAVLEPFSQTSAESIRSEAFTAQPAPIDRLLRQEDLVRAAGFEHISFYHALTYMSVFGGPEASTLGGAWMRSFQRRNTHGFSS